MKANVYQLEKSELLRSTPPELQFKLVDVVNAITQISKVTATQLYSVARKYMIWRRRAYFIAVHDLGFSHPQTAAAMQRDSTSVTYALKTYADHEDKTNLDIIRMFAAREAAKREHKYQLDKPEFQIVQPVMDRLRDKKLSAKPRLRPRLRGGAQTAAIAAMERCAAFSAALRVTAALLLSARSSRLSCMQPSRLVSYRTLAVSISFTPSVERLTRRHTVRLAPQS